MKFTPEKVSWRTLVVIAIHINAADVAHAFPSPGVVAMCPHREVGAEVTPANSNGAVSRSVVPFRDACRYGGDCGVG